MTKQIETKEGYTITGIKNKKITAVLTDTIYQRKRQYTTSRGEHLTWNLKYELNNITFVFESYNTMTNFIELNKIN